MKKLLLTSAGFLNSKIADKFLNLVNKPVSKIKIVFVPTAALTEEEKYYVRYSKKELLKLEQAFKPAKYKTNAWTRSLF